MQANLTRFPRGLAAAAAALSLSVSPPAGAADFTLSGLISFHNDVVHIDFSLAQPATNVRLWTDSWQGGLNFDPVAALWQAAGSDFNLLDEVDDDDGIAPGQGFYDTGFNLPALAAGNYRVTVAAAFNGANGNLLSQGFNYGGEAPILLSAWNQPSFDPNANDQKGGFWRLNLSGVDQASVVPEPAAWLMLLLGLMVVAPALARSRVSSRSFRLRFGT
jgi:hypothetical protein